MPQDALFSSGSLFDFALRMEEPSELSGVLHRLALGFSAPGGFVAHISLPLSVQSAATDIPQTISQVERRQPVPSDHDVAEVAQRLRSEPFGIWIGFGARGAAEPIRHLAERTGAAVVSSPRAKGIFPEDHPLFRGVSGLGGHEAVGRYTRLERPQWWLVLGSRLGEATSFWDTDLLPGKGFIHVDVDSGVPGTAYPGAQTIGIQSDVSCFLERLLARMPPAQPVSGVAPRALMGAIQRRVVDGANALVFSESGNSFAWSNHYLRFQRPGQYRVSTHFGAMGHASAGVVGAALATQRKAVALVGDGALLMQPEISTAVRYRAPAVWVVLNDGGYGMCIQGHAALGLTRAELDFPRVDFAKFAESLGAEGLRVEVEGHLDAALERALRATGPFVVDVLVNSREESPVVKRFTALRQQGCSPAMAGWQSEPATK